MTTLILVRHGASVWNERNLFTGWVDIPLSPKGIEEAKAAGRQLARQPIDLAFTSDLIRAQMTALYILEAHESKRVPRLIRRREGQKASWERIYSAATEKETIPLYAAWELNERMYGELQGKNKDEMRREYGAEQVQIWRRSFDGVPPGGESLEMTAERTLPYFHQHIVPHIREGKNILVAAHGNSLRSIIMDLEKLSKKQVIELEVPLGVPLIYQYADGHWKKGG
jgi:2,3-bisphosphoglycerate-dependent phosphoglycerate mutase